jgi:hypothetical protein
MDYTQELHAIAMIWAALIAIAVASFALLRASCRELMMCAAVAVLTIAIPRLAAAQPIDVKEAWLKRDCKDKGTLDHPTSNPEFEACLRKLIEPLPPLDKNRRELFGEQYDPSKYIACRTRPGNRTNSACNVYILRRREWPEYWPEGAKKIKWPEAPKESVYRKGMTPKEYWEALCKAEAGEFIYKTVKDVEGFLLVRLRAAETDHVLRDRFVIEDAYGALEFYSIVPEKRPGVFFVDRARNSYRYVEAMIPGSTGTVQRVRHEADLKKLAEYLRTKVNDTRWGEEAFSQIVEVATFISRHGLTWRGIRRDHDLDLGVSGGELAIVDLVTGETIALRRGFALDPYANRGAKNERWWLGSSGCPHLRRDFLTLTAFVRRALPPKGLQ